jgi:hypothetical protein
MTRKRRLVFAYLIIACVSFAGCFKSKTEVQRVPTRTEIAEGRKPLKKLDGVPYRLPRTVVQVSLPVKKVEQEPGPFVKYAPCFFTANDLSDLITESSKKFGLQTPQFSTLGEPDPEESYVVKIKGGYFENKSLLMEYTPAGVLSKGEAESKDQSLEFTLKAIKKAASIGGALAGIRVPGADVDTAAMSENQRAKLLQDREELNQQLNDSKRCYHSIRAFADKTANEANLEKDKAWAQLKTADQAHYAEASERYAATLEKLKAAQDGARIAHLDESKFDGPFTPQVKQLVDEYLQAKEAHDRILAMQNRREALVSQPANVSQETFNRLLEETDKTIEGYRAAFLGLQTEKVWKGVFTYRPTKYESQLSLPFFVYSSTDGLCEIGLSAQQGQHVPPAFKSGKCENVGSLKGVWLLVEKDRDDDEFRRRIAMANLNSQNSEEARGWYYRIPAKAVAYVIAGKMSGLTTADLESVSYHDPRIGPITEVGRSDISVAQLGIVASIPASAAGRTNQAAITLDETTGALRNFKYSSTSLLEKSMLEDVEGASKDTIDAKDPLKKKKRELDMLKTEKDIRDAKKALENSNSNPPQ